MIKENKLTQILKVVAKTIIQGSLGIAILCGCVWLAVKSIGLIFNLFK
jgi:hypothetical protein